MIEFKNVTKKYDHIVLNKINLKIKDGEFVSLVGPSGAGKSTLLYLLTKEEKPTSGAVFIDNIDIGYISNKDIHMLRRKIGTVFQNFKLLANKTVLENVAFALEVSGVSQEEINQDVPQLLQIVGLADKINRFPHQLSGGEQQRLAIARALIHRPKIILADEPTGNLDLINSYDVLKLLYKINEFGTTVILATHDREIVNTVGKRVITLEDGKIVRDQHEKGTYKLS